MSNMPYESPRETLLKFAEGFRISKALQAAAELGIADILKDSPKSFEEIAQITSTHAPSLYRVLRALASEQIFRENDQGLFENTVLSEALYSEAANSVREHVIYIPHDGNILAWTRFMDVLKTGKSSFKEATGFDTMWDYLQAHPEMEKHFNRAMSSYAAEIYDVILKNYDFSSFKSVIDIGGGEGLLIKYILQACLHINGVLFELPSVTEQAQATFTDPAIASRSKIIAGNIFTDKMPTGYDAYIMKWVLHNWGDDEAYKILKRCREAIPSHGKLIIFDAVMTSGNTANYSKWIDLHMMITLGGKERTKEDFEKLLLRANFKMIKVRDLTSIGIIEAAPI